MLYAVDFNALVLFVAFDAEAAKTFATGVDDDSQCAVTNVTELPLIDHYGFACARKDAGTLFPWLGEVSAEVAVSFLNEEIVMSPAERDRFERDEEIAYWNARHDYWNSRFYA